MIELNHVYCGDVLEVLKTLPDESVNCCVTSPPYWWLRDYGKDEQLGLEKTPEEYVQHMVEVFREVRRVLKNDGTLWLNLGDSYVGTGSKNDLKDPKYAEGRNGQSVALNNHVEGLKRKDLIGIPWRVAFALQADGWYLRSDIIWHKPNAMPEPVKDRPTKAHEYIFLMSKSSKYYYDYEAIKEPLSDNSDVNYRRQLRASRHYDVKEPYKSNTPFAHNKQDNVGKRMYFGFNERYFSNESIQTKRNKRTVWSVTTKPFKGAHFATFPPDLIEPCILAGCPKDGLVLDPFFGAGTTGLVAQQHERNYIGIELNPAYIEIATTRIESAVAERKRLESDYVQTKLML